MRNILRRLGWVLVAIGIVPGIMHLYDRFSMETVRARVIAVDSYCRPASCPACRYLRSTCTAAEADPALSAGLMRHNYVRLLYRTSRGRQLVSRMSFARLKIRDATLGEEVAVSFRRDKPTQLQPASRARPIGVFILPLVAGLALLGFGAVAGGRAKRRTGAPALPTGSKKPAEGALDGISTAWGAAADKPKRADPQARPTQTAKLPPRVPQVSIPTRRHRQGRNRGLFG